MNGGVRVPGTKESDWREESAPWRKNVRKKYVVVLTPSDACRYQRRLTFYSKFRSVLSSAAYVSASPLPMRIVLEFSRRILGPNQVVLGLSLLHIQSGFDLVQGCFPAQC